MKVFGGFTRSRSAYKTAASELRGHRALGSADRLIALADELRDRRDWRQAADRYREALEIDPDLKHIWVQLGNCEKESGRFEPAELAYRRSVEIDPLLADTHLQLGHVLKLQGKLADAKASYETALELDPQSSFARTEAAALGSVALESASVGPKDVVAEGRLVFDCSDLVERFHHARLPTGIWRVQVNIIESGLSLDNFVRRVRIVFCTKYDPRWLEIPRLDFLSLVNAAQQLDSVGESAWETIVNRICTLDAAPEFEFAKGDTLINLGSSWWVEDYFLRIRNMKAEFGVKYAPFVHDCMPLATPEHCTENLTREFAAWMEGLFRHADYFLANSSATEADLLRIAKEFKKDRPDIHVVRLDGKLDALSDGVAGRSDPRKLRTLFEMNDMKSKGPEPPNFVLLVSTLESRKNHLLAFMVWDQLIAKLGFDDTPYLACVGPRGEMFDNALAYLGSRPKLQRKVRFLSGVDDQTLPALYDGCQFTFYPSHYEGWGFPVTESLSHGKVPAIANVSSLPEAGGDLAQYFGPLAPREALAVVEKLISDVPYRQGLERKIKAEFRTRPWNDIAADLLKAASARAEAHRVEERLSSVPGWIEPVEPASVYSFAKVTGAADLAIKSGTHMRVGKGWFGSEDWGTWTRAGDARLAFRFDDKDSRELVVYLRLKSAPAKGVSVQVSANFSDSVLAVALGPNETKWCRLAFTVRERDVAVKELTFWASELVNLAKVTDGKDGRRVGCGLCSLGIVSSADVIGRLALLEAATVAFAVPA